MTTTGNLRMTSKKKKKKKEKKRKKRREKERREYNNNNGKGKMFGRQQFDAKCERSNKIFFSFFD